MPNLDYYNVAFDRSEDGKRIVVRGEVQNNSGRNFNAVAIRLILYNKNIPMVNTVIVVNGLPHGATRSFEKYIEEIDYNQVAKLINRIECYTESTY